MHALPTAAQSTPAVLAAVIAHANAGRRAEALALCGEAVRRQPRDAALLQMLALLCLHDGALAVAREHIEASLALRPEHAPSQRIAADVWFESSLALQDARDLAGAAAALRRVLALAPERAEAWVNLGIVLQDAAQRGAALAAYGRALRLRPEAFGRIAHALASSAHGAVWLDREALRQQLLAAAQT